MTWVLSKLPPIIPHNRDYIEVMVKLANGELVNAFYCRRWGWRDYKFNELLNVLEWEYR